MYVYYYYYYQYYQFFIVFIVLIIFCKYCSAFYIGQSIDLKDRIYNHIYKIKNFIPFETSNTCVSNHFNLKFHNYKFHFTFFIFRGNVNNFYERLNIESFLINLFLKLNLNVINDYIPNIKNRFISID